jgi:hypothetical protein
MLRSLILFAGIVALTGSPALAAIWPEAFYGPARTSLTSAPLPREPVWEEFGLEEIEIAEYSGEGDSFKATAYRFGDSTSAMAVFQWKRPRGYQPSEAETLAVESADSLYLAHGNYILHFEGRKPSEQELNGLYLVLPLKEESSLPALPEYLPASGRIAGSERYVTGPASLKEFEPRISPSVAGFHFGAEAQLASFETPRGEMRLAIFSYPTPHIARARLVEFRMLPGAVAKRSGPLVALILDPPDADEAQRLLGRVNYRATITWHESMPKPEPNLAEFLLTAFALIGVLVAFAIMAGLAFGAYRLLLRRTGVEGEDPMILLHLEDR